MLVTRWKSTRIDAALLADHSKLHATDECYFWREYASGRHYSFGRGNDLISNLKMKPSRMSQAEGRHKDRVIRECSAFFREAIHEVWLQSATIVPMPGSKMDDHLDYDDRMVRVITGVRDHLDVRRLVRLRSSMQASHECGVGERATVAELVQNFQIDETLAAPTPGKIAVFDDVLTAGVHFRAISIVLNARFPGVPIYGFFAARRIFPPL